MAGLVRIDSQEVRLRVQVRRGELPRPPLLDRQGRHRRVVRAQAQRRDEQLRPLLRAHRLQRRPQRLVRRHAAADRQPLQPGLPQRLLALRRPARPRPPPGSSPRGRPASGPAAAASAFATSCPWQAYSTAVFSPLKLNSSRSSSRNERGKANAFGSPAGRLALDGRAAGEAEPEDRRHLVERLAGRVVAGAAEQRQ